MVRTFFCFLPSVFILSQVREKCKPFFLKKINFFTLTLMLMLGPAQYAGSASGSPREDPEVLGVAVGLDPIHSAFVGGEDSLGGLGGQVDDFVHFSVSFRFRVPPCDYILSHLAGFVNNFFQFRKNFFPGWVSAC